MGNHYLKEIIEPGDRASRLAGEICFRSHQNCQAVIVVPHQPDNFRGPVGWRWQKHILRQMLRGNIFEEAENDGAGGKPQFFTLVGTSQVFRNLAWEIIAMTADDFARSGRFPAIMANELNVKRLTEANFPLIQAAFEGYGVALEETGLVNITGEIAVMRHSITAFCDTDHDTQLVLTWGAACIGLAHKKLLINGSKIKPGMAVVGFRDAGYRCNGGTFFTNLILEKWGSPCFKDFWSNAEMLDFVKALTVPSQSYAKTICRLVGWKPDGSIGKPLARIYGIAHITGGGVWGKFGEILPPGVGADLYSLPKPADVLLRAQELSWDTKYRLTDWQAYSTLHGACGMLLVCEPVDCRIIIQEAAKDGIQAHVVGETFPSAEREVAIKSRFKEGKRLSSLRPE